MSEIRAWLESIGCGRYADAFEQNDITLELIGDLADEDLKELGLSIGDRKRFKRAAAALAPAAPDTPAPDTPARDTPAPDTPAPDSPEPERHAAHHSAHAERRRLTVMFVDLVGSTDLAGRLDPEEWGEVLRAYQDTVAGLVTRFEGHVAQYLGDGMLCYFGWPKAMEDAAERAVEAGLEIVESVNRLRTGAGAGKETLACRIGIATGQVVVGEFVVRGDSADEAAIGEVMNFAARLQAFAGTGQVVISEATRRLIGNAFILEPLGEHAFKGIAARQTIYAVVSSNPEHDRFAGREGLTTGAIVGRESELALLLDRWALAKEGRGQVVNLVGEAGIGKSRICRALFEALGNEPCRRIKYQCSPYLRDTALWPVINRIIAATGIQKDDTNDQRLDKLERLFHEVGETDGKRIAVIAEAIGLDAEARYGPLDMSPAARRAATFSILSSNIVALSKREPVLILLEDAHWADPTTLELIATIIDRLESERIMLLVTSRPEGDVILSERDCVTTINLGRLDRKGVAEIIERLGAGRLPPEMIEAVIERTDGVPLFVEELTKAMIESGEMTVPASLHDTLMSRLDRLPEVKEVAQIASVFGRDFEADPVASVAELSRQRVIEALDALRKVELVFSRIGGDDHFSFKHALVRDAAYESLLNRRRQEIHGRILDVLRESEAAMPGVLAQHAAEARRFDDAVHYGRLAAEQALRRPAYAEAIAHLEAALGVLDGLPPSETTLAERKRLLLLSGQARIAHFGYAHESTVATFAEIERIARQTGDRVLLVEGLYGRWAGHYVPGRLPPALEVADTICEVSTEANDTLARALGHRLRGTVLTMMGRVEAADTALDEADRLYDPAHHRRHASRFGQDVGIASRCYRIGGLVLGGRFDSAAALARRVLADLEGVNHAHTQGYALGHLALFLSAAEILPLGAEVAERCVAVSERDRMPLWSALGRASLAMAHVREGRAGEALPELRDALETLQRLKFTVFRPLLVPSYALALGWSGQVSTAATLLAETREVVEANEARYSEAEIAAAEGQLRQLAGDAAGAEARHAHALERARSLGHLLWELRAAESLEALMRETGRAEEGRRLLAAVIARFEEGHALPLLQRVGRTIA